MAAANCAENCGSGALAVRQPAELLISLPHDPSQRLRVPSEFLAAESLACSKHHVIQFARDENFSRQERQTYMRLVRLSGNLECRINDLQRPLRRQVVRPPLHEI